MRIAWNKGLTKEDPRVLKYALSKIGKKRSEETNAKISKVLKEKYASGELINPNKGRSFPEFQGEAHPNWKGERASYVAKHMWVKKYLGQPDICEGCNKSGLTGHNIHWANKSGDYKRVKSDWIRLCSFCH